MKDLPLKIYNFFGRPPISYKTMTLKAAIAYGIIVFAIFSLISESASPANMVWALFAALLSIKLFLSDSGIVLAKLWNQTFGKLIYATTALILVQVSQMLADFEIQGLVQTNPAQLATGQRFLTISFVLFGVVAIFYFLMITFLVVGVMAAILSFIYRVSVEPNIKRFHSFAQLFSIAALFSVQFPAPQIDPAAAWIEVGFVRVVFLSNSKMQHSNKYGDWLWLACNNLPPDSLVAFASSDKVIPDEVIEARPTRDETPWNEEWKEYGEKRKEWEDSRHSKDLAEPEFKFVYRRTKCDNSNGDNQPNVIPPEPKLRDIPD